MNFFLQFGEFVGEGGTDWPNVIISAIVSLLSSFIGAGVAIYVYRNSIKDQKRKELDKRNSDDVIKVKYFYYLMEQAITELYSIINNIDVIVRDYGKDGNYFTAPNFSNLPPVSIERITKSISQEYYFDAITNQVQNIEPYDIFLTFDQAEHLRKELYMYIETKLNENKEYKIYLENQHKKFLFDVHRFSITKADDLTRIQLKSIIKNFEDIVKKEGMNYYIHVNDSLLNPVIECFKTFNNIDDVNDITNTILEIATYHSRIETNNKNIISFIFKNRQKISDLVNKLDKSVFIIKEALSEMSNSVHVDN